MNRRKKRRQATRLGRSVRAEPKREKTVVEIVFGDPDDDATPNATAKMTDASVQDCKNDSPLQQNRFVFRF